MPYRKIFSEKDQLFHIISRAVDERKIFIDDLDCYRFILQLYIANIGRPEHNLWRKDTTRLAQALLQGEDLSSKFVIKEHIPFVNILDFSLVVNHYHFYLASNIDNGIPLLMHKLNLGFATYFNLKYRRWGALFGSRYKSVHVKTEAQAHVVRNYVSIINPLDVYQPGWRNNGLKDWGKAFEFLKNYQFSSFPDRIDQRRSKILVSKEIFERYFSRADIETEREIGSSSLIEFVKNYLEQKLGHFEPFLLE